MAKKAGEACGTVLPWRLIFMVMGEEFVLALLCFPSF